MNFLYCKDLQDNLRDEILKDKHIDAAEGVKDLHRFIELFKLTFESGTSNIADERLLNNLKIEAEVQRKKKILQFKLEGLKKRRRRVENSIRDYYNSQKIKVDVLKDYRRNRRFSQIELEPITRMNIPKCKYIHKFCSNLNS